MRYPRIVTAIGLLIFSILLLLFSYFDELPYGYFTLIRLLISITSLTIFYAFMKFKKSIFLGAAIILIMYNPIIVIHLDREIWKIINSITISYFILIIIYIWIKLVAFEKANKNKNLSVKSKYRSMSNLTRF